MANHVQTQHGWYGRAMTLLIPFPTHTPKWYRMAYPFNATSINCPVEGLPGRATINPNLGLYFLHLHIENKIIILNLGIITHPWLK